PVTVAGQLVEHGVLMAVRLRRDSREDEQPPVHPCGTVSLRAADGAVPATVVADGHIEPGGALVVDRRGLPYRALPVPGHGAQRVTHGGGGRLGIVIHPRRTTGERRGQRDRDQQMACHDCPPPSTS